MRRLRRMLLALLGCAAALCLHVGAAQADYSVLVASDLHYIAPSLTDNGPCYQRVLANGDSKFMPYSEAITDAFLDEVLQACPEALLLTGDLTFNGAVISHEALIEKLRRIEEIGIPVLVQTGNHDVYNLNAAKYEGESYTLLPSATTESFAALYADFGLNEALAVDPDSLSYLYPLNESTWVLMLDLNTAHNFCGLSDGSLRWIETQLQAAQEAGVQVLAAGHQNLFQHSIFRGGYVLDGADALGGLFARYGVPLYLSGHLHIQHIQTENGVTEIATSALCSYPCQYGVLSSLEGRIHYETRELDMAAWSERNGQNAPVYAAFREAAAAWMRAHFKAPVLPASAEAAAEWEAMLDYLGALNLAYFSGDLREIPALDPEGRYTALWTEAGDLTALYVASIVPDLGKSFCVWDSP